MNIKIFFLILVSVSLSALAQVTLKAGMSGERVQAALPRGGLEMAWVIASDIYVIGGLLLYALGAVLWLLVLARLDVSFAYPFVGIGFLLTMLFGVLLLGESLNANRILGTLLVAAGIVFVSRS